MKPEILSNSVFVSASGGVLDVVRDGEVLASIAVPAGMVGAAQYLALLPDGAVLEVAGGLSVLQPKGGYAAQPYGDGSHDSGANPDFQPSSADLMQRQLLHIVGDLTRRVNLAEAKDRARAYVERIPDAPVVESVEPGPAGEE